MTAPTRTRGVRVNSLDQTLKFCVNARDAAVNTGRVTVYYDGQIFDFRSAGRENIEDEALIVGVYSPSASPNDIREDIEFVMQSRRKAPFRQVRKS